MNLQAIIFGSIGTITEMSELQRAAFNAAFAEAGLDWHWSAEEYQRLVADGSSGGRERIVTYAASLGATGIDAVALHDRKGALFQKAMTSGGISANPGVMETLIKARAAGIATAMASTTSAANVNAMFASTAPLLTAAMFDVVTNADTVARGKPAPDVYLAVLEHLGVSANAAVAIEDTVQSAAAPIAAGIVTLIIPGAIAREQDFGRCPVAPSLEAFGGLGAIRALLAYTTAPA